jgi:putative DNA primase/helicase
MDTITNAPGMSTNTAIKVPFKPGDAQNRRTIATADYLNSKGIAVLPVKAGRKKPHDPWKKYNGKRPERQSRADFANPDLYDWSVAERVAPVLSRTGLMALDCDEASLDLVLGILDAMGVEKCWVSYSQSGEGIHVLFKCDPESIPADYTSGNLVFVPSKATSGLFKQIELKYDGHIVVLMSNWVDGFSPDDISFEDLTLYPFLDILHVLQRIGQLSSRGQSKDDFTESRATKIPTGTHDIAMTSIAGSLRKRGASKQLIGTVLVETGRIMCEPPWVGEEDLWAKADYAVSSRAGWVVTDDPAAAPKVDTETSLLIFNRSDLGNAERAARHFGYKVRYVTEDDQFIVYREGRWQHDPKCIELRKLIRDMLREYIFQAYDMSPGPQRVDHIKWAINSENEPRIRGLLANLSTPCEHISLSQLDQHPLQINLPNGTYHVETGELRNHDPADFHTRIMPVNYDPLAPLPKSFNRFLETTFVKDGAPDTELISYVQRSVGYTMTGSTRERAGFLCYGDGKNGKSTLFRVIRKLMGEYSRTANPASFDSDRMSDKGDDIAKWVGARYVEALETEDGHKLAAARFKSLTGEDDITCRALYGSNFTYTPQYKIWFGTNHLPSVNGGDQAMWDRIKLIPFNSRFDETTEIKSDNTLKEKLADEMPGILNWALEGAAMWLKDGLGKSETVALATKSYREISDTIGQFIEECCEIDPSKGASTTALHQAYEAWMTTRGELATAKKMKAFTTDLTRRCYRTGKTRDATIPGVSKNLMAVVGLHLPSVGHFSAQSMPAEKINTGQLVLLTG